jgi:CspA family cold shock protein
MHRAGAGVGESRLTGGAGSGRFAGHRSREEDTAIATGTVKWYDIEKGYGFVYEDNANRDVFLHSADIQEPEPKVLYEGHRVSFEVEDSDRGPRAVTVAVITGTERPDEDDTQTAEFDADDEDEGESDD